MNELYWVVIRLNNAVNVVLLRRVGQAQQAERLQLTFEKICRRKQTSQRDVIELAGAVVAAGVAAVVAYLA